MKIFNLLVAVLVLACHASAADPLTEKLQRGLFEEEANHNLAAAIKEYQSVVAQSDEQRKVIATALFRLGECYRKLGRTNEAYAQYQRIFRDFSEQEQLVRLSRELLPHSSALLASPNTVSDPVAVNLLREEIRLVEQSVQAKERLLAAGRAFLSDVINAKKEVLRLKRRLPENAVPSQQRRLLEEQIEIVKQYLADIEKRASDRRVPEEELSIQRELLSLQRELATSSGAARSFVGTEAAATDEEEKEVRRIQAMIKDSPDLINAHTGLGGGGTPLHRATSAGQLVVARFLLSNNADANAKNSVGDAPLHLAASRGHKSMVELLLDHGAEVNATARNGTPLHYAAGNGFRAVVEVLLARGAEVNAKTAGGQTPLHNTVGNGHKAVAELLLDKGADMNAATIDGWVALHMAANAMNKPLTELLVARGARIDAKRDDGQTPLSVAVVMKSPPVAEALLANKADPSIPDKTGTTPLSYAVQKASSELVDLLLAYGADPNLGDRNAVMPLHWASISGEAAMVEALLKNKAAPDPKINWGTGVPAPTYRTPENYNVNIPHGATPLWLAVAYQKVKVADWLLSFGAPINARITITSGGGTSVFTPLEIATSQRNKEMVKLLLERKANPNVSDANNMTPLMTAAGNRSREIVELLLAQGAEVNVLSANGGTPLSIAQSQWGGSPASPDIAELLLKHGAIEDLQRAASITVARGVLKYQVFQKDTNGLNRFSLLEALAQHYAPGKSQQNYFQFPDFARVRIRSLKSKAGDKENIVDLETAFQFTNCAPNTWLEWGDLIELPEQDHVVNVPWSGLSVPARNTLTQCLRKQVQILVKGQTNVVILTPALAESGGLNAPRSLGRSLPPPSFPGGIAGAGTLGTATPAQLGPPVQIELTVHWLNDVVRAANVIRSSSDLTRVKVKRAGAGDDAQKEMMFDLVRLDKANDLWLRDGDVIEIPEKP